MHAVIQGNLAGLGPTPRKAADRPSGKFQDLVHILSTYSVLSVPATGRVLGPYISVPYR